MLLSEVEQSEDAAIVATRMLQAVAEAHSIDQHDLHVTTSIGVSVYPDDGVDAETLIKNADTAMYQAKENGRQSYQFFKPAMNVRAVERQSIEESLRRALERREFVAALPAEDRPADRGDHRRGSACSAGRIPTRGRSPRRSSFPIAEDCGLIRADRQLGASRRLRAGPGLGRRGPAPGDDGRERLGDGVAGRELPRRRASRSSTRPAWTRAASSWS